MCGTCNSLQSRTAPTVSDEGEAPQRAALRTRRRRLSVGSAARDPTQKKRRPKAAFKSISCASCVLQARTNG